MPFKPSVVLEGAAAGKVAATSTRPSFGALTGYWSVGATGARLASPKRALRHRHLLPGG